MNAILTEVEYQTTHSNIKKELNLHANKPLSAMTISNLVRIHFLWSVTKSAYILWACNSSQVANMLSVTMGYISYEADTISRHG
jgi:hypothetical protein